MILFKYSLVSLILVIILISTNRSFSYEEASLLNGYSDIATYYNISSSGFINSEVKASLHHLERWPIHKLIGLISKNIEIDLWLIYKISVGLLIVTTILIINLFKCNDVNKIVAFAFILFNPYTFRSYYAVPAMISDGAFMVAVLLVTCGIVNKSHLQIIGGSILAILFRQTGILLIPIFAFLSYYKYISKRSLLLGSLAILMGFIFINLVTLKLYGHLSHSSYYNLATGIISWFFQKPELREAISFFGRYIFFLLTLSGLILCVNQFTSRKILFIWTSSFFFLHLQPLAGGPLFTGGNIQRLSALSIPLLIPIIINSNIDKRNYALFVLTCIIISFNHRTSKLYYFDNSQIIFLLLVISSFIFSAYSRYSSSINKVS